MRWRVVCHRGRPEAIVWHVEHDGDFLLKFKALPVTDGVSTLDHVEGLYILRNYSCTQCEVIEIETDETTGSGIFKAADEAIKNGLIRTRFPAL